MQLKLLYQGFIYLVLYVLTQCENQEKNIAIEHNKFPKIGHNILQHGRIISKPVVQPMPVDQMEPLKLQHDDINEDKPKYIAHGDILTPIEDIELFDSKRIKRKVIVETDSFGYSNRWPRGVIPYQFISGIDYRVQQNVLNAIQHWHQRTCIRFEPYNAGRHWDIGAKITIEDSGSGCATYVGYRSPITRQPLSYSVYLPITCPLGSAIHELGHVIGFYHEMARTDRDKEINLYFSLMGNVEREQYNIMPNPMPGYYGQPYDLGSIMHYYPTNVMAARDNRRTFLMGQRIGLSFLDVKLANLAYHCSDNCNPKPVCENEGFVNQYCQCTCADGFYGDRCQLLQGYLSTTRIFPPNVESPILVEVEKPQTKSSTPATSTPASLRWLEWSNWSNCSESCGSGIRVRTRLCSNTTTNDSFNPCSSLEGDSFEIESCQNTECKQADIIMSCTFDLHDEKCPIENKNNWQIQDGTQKDQIQPIADHTLGDGKYIILTGDSTQSIDLQKMQLGPFTHSKDSNEKNHCLQFWYSAHGQGIGKIHIVYDKINNQQNEETFMFNEKDQDTNWKQIQRTISNENDYKIIFTYISNSSEHNYLAIDDISLTNGVCSLKKINSERRRKRRQTLTGCSNIIDLTISNKIATITSPSYPNLYPANSQCYYYIRAPGSSRINLQFTDFNVPTNSINECDDSIEIRYYHLGQAGPQYCGTGANSNNLQFTSTKNILMIVLRSDEYYSGRGFRAQASLVQ